MWQTALHVQEESTAMTQGSLNLLDFVRLVISASMLHGQTSLKIMTISHQEAVCALQTLLEENAKKAFSALQDPMNQLPVQEAITVKAKASLLSLRSVTQVGSVPVELQCHDHQMESPGIFAHQDGFAAMVPKCRSSAPWEHFPITLGIAMRATALLVQKDLIVKLED